MRLLVDGSPLTEECWMHQMEDVVGTSQPLWFLQGSVALVWVCVEWQQCREHLSLSPELTSACVSLIQ